MNRTDKYLQHSSIIWPVWLYGWVFTYELSGSGFESPWSHLLFIAIDNGVLKDSSAILAKAGGRLSWPIVLLGFGFWRLCLTSLLFKGEKIVLSLVVFFAVIAFLRFKILG